MNKRMTIVIIALLVIFGSIFGFNILRSYLIERFEKNFAPPPPTISAAKATTQTWEPTLMAVGSLTAINGVNVSSEVSGSVIAIRFISGQMVEKGQSLIQLDDSADIQDLKNNQAELDLSKVDYIRKAALWKTGAVSRSDYDQALATLRQSEAAVNKSLVALSKKNIRAPFSGKIGIRQVNIGQYVNPGDTLVALQSLDPLFINFSLPEQYLKELYLTQRISVFVDAYPNEHFYGKITAINALVTESTRSISVQATIPNKDYRLYPGSFADVRIYLPEQQSVIAVPQTAVTYSLYGNTIYVVQQGKDKKGKPVLQAFQHYVAIGGMQGNFVIIKKGIRVGDMIVTSGQNKLQNGITVLINNDITLTPINPRDLIGP